MGNWGNDSISLSFLWLFILFMLWINTSVGVDRYMKYNIYCPHKYYIKPGKRIRKKYSLSASSIPFTVYWRIIIVYYCRTAFIVACVIALITRFNSQFPIICTIIFLSTLVMYVPLLFLDFVLIPIDNIKHKNQNKIRFKDKTVLKDLWENLKSSIKGLKEQSDINGRLKIYKKYLPLNRRCKMECNYKFKGEVYIKESSLNSLEEYIISEFPEIIFERTAKDNKFFFIVYYPDGSTLYEAQIKSKI